MRREYVLRTVDGEEGPIRFSLRAHNQVQTQHADALSLTVLRRDENGFAVLLIGERVVSGFTETRNGDVTITVDGRPETFSLRPAAVDAMRQGLLHAKSHGGVIDVKSPIPGLIKGVLIEVNAAVTAGQALAVLEAMKMENEIRAPHAGIVEKVCAAEGQNVAAGALLFSIKTP